MKLVLLILFEMLCKIALIKVLIFEFDEVLFKVLYAVNVYEVGKEIDEDNELSNKFLIPNKMFCCCGTGI